MKKKFLTLLALVSLVFQISAEEHDVAVQTNASPYGFSLSFLGMSRYYGSIVGGLFYTGGPMSFTDIAVSRKDTSEHSWLGWSGVNRLDLSLGQKLDSISFDHDGGNEYDFIVGRSAYFGRTNFPVHFDASLTYLAVHPLTQMRNDVIETVLTLDLPKTPFIQPYLTLYRFDVVDGHGSGLFIATGVVHTDVLFKIHNTYPISFSEEYRFGWAATKGIFGTDDGPVYHRLILSVNAKWNKHFFTRLSWIGQISADGQAAGQGFIDHSRQFLEGAAVWSF